MAVADEKGTPNIIITEEDEHASNLMMAAFKLEGFMPLQAWTAEECLSKVKELGGKLDAIVIDGKLASDRGKMLIVNIRNMNRKAKIFVLAERFEEEHKTRGARLWGRRVHDQAHQHQHAGEQGRHAVAAGHADQNLNIVYKMARNFAAIM